MEPDMKRYSQERKAAVLAKLLPPYNMTVSLLAQQEGISDATLYNWRNQARLEGKADSLASASHRLIHIVAAPVRSSIIKPATSLSGFNQHTDSKIGNGDGFRFLKWVKDNA